MMQDHSSRGEPHAARRGDMLLASIFLSSTVACGAPVTDQPEYRENPAPSRMHGIEVRIEDAPGEFGHVLGAMQFDVINRTCLPPPDANPGGHTSPVPTRTIPFALEKGDDGVWRGTVVADGMVDEDYHGRGVCHWALVNVQVQFKATGAKEETLFIADLDGEEAVIGGSREIYFGKVLYPRHPDSTTDEPFVIGRAGRAAKAHLGDDELFKVTLGAAEASP